MCVREAAEPPPFDLIEPALQQDCCRRGRSRVGVNAGLCPERHAIARDQVIPSRSVKKTSLIGSRTRPQPCLAVGENQELCRAASGEERLVGVPRQCNVRILTFTTLYPSVVRPQHGIFVETRLVKLVQSGAVSARVMAPCPWFPLAFRRGSVVMRDLPGSHVGKPSTGYTSITRDIRLCRRSG